MVPLIIILISGSIVSGTSEKQKPKWPTGFAKFINSFIQRMDSTKMSNVKYGYKTFDIPKSRNGTYYFGINTRL